ncbi:chaperonin 10-like protein [Lineolata rhizophorae]|uniref:Chaperonin 10-like protein n=1 Tax=Lineolata rhizophorae TaxID=578093 RepID=A0A6A6NX37_9PEZI|nr:chaperonin 10-like protein [Lineolata rhizophorae]
MPSGTMRAVVFKEPHRVEVEQRPIPQIEDPKDVIVKVEYTALCGSELHVFRGHQPSPVGFIMGHEFTGTVEEAGADVMAFKKGDRIVSPFTTACGECFYCTNGFSSRCESVKLFGSAVLEGAQAQYVRVPSAPSTLFPSPPSAAIPAHLQVLLSDIFPTGYFGARTAFSFLPAPSIRDSTCVLLGCGPVGLCALVCALDYAPRRVVAVDGVQARLDRARELGATETLSLDVGRGKEGRDEVVRKVKEWTAGRGADVVIEVVGLSDALRLGFEVLRPWGGISSIGVHNGEIPWTGNEAYGKNLRIHMGRCPVRSIFPEALEQLKKKQHLLGFMADKIMPLTQAVEGYELFDKMKVQKVIFEAQK